MKIGKQIIKTIVFMAIVFSCTNNSESSQEVEKQELLNLKTEIEKIIDEGTCTENTECEFIAFGSKPCGGAWSYLVFSNNIDVVLLKEKISNYNKLENDYNIKWNVISDCMAVLPPTNIECINGKCTATN